MLIIAATRDGGQLLMYPRAAIKQSMQLFTSNSTYPQFDIELQFNSRRDWHFDDSAQSSEDFSGFQCNNNLIIDWAMTSLVRGMGMTSSFTIRRNFEHVPYLAPKTFTTARNTYFEPYTAFDSILHVKELSLKSNQREVIQLINVTRSFPTSLAYPGTKVEDFIFAVFGSKRQFKIGKYLWVMIADPRLVAKLPNRDLSLWWTTYNSDSNIEFFVNEPRAVNVWEIPDDEDTLEVRNSSMFLNQMEISRSRILELIGYRTVKNSLPSNFTVSTTFGTPEYNPADSKYYQDDDGEMLVRTFESVDSLARKKLRLTEDEIPIE